MDRIAKFLILLVAALVLVPGCFAEEQTTESANTTVEEVVDLGANETATNETPVEETVEAVVPDFTANETIITLEMGVNQTVAIALGADDKEGEWLTNMTEGLEQVGNATVTNGTTEWFVKTTATGEQTFNATHFHVVEGESASEPGETYNLGIVVA